MSAGGRRVEVAGVQVPTDHLIGGHRVGGRERFEVRSPIDWDRWALGEVAAGGPPEVDAAVAAARRAFPAWAALGPAGRPGPREALAAEIDAAVPALAAVECVDNGSLLEAMRERVRHDPAGVVAISTPWNAPFMLATWRVGPALAAGNTVVLKPPEWAPLTCSLLGELAERAGLPPGVLNIVHGTGAGAGAPLTGHPGIDRVAFTGSPATARTVYRDAGAQLTPVSFELGGKSPFLVFADGDLDAAAATAAYQYDNAGQVCLAGTRLLVAQSVLEPFLARLRERVGAIVVGDPREPETTYGPLIHPIALERVTERVARARAQGARLVFGGRPLAGLYYPPTLFADLPPDAEILRREVFGPVLTIQPFADEAQALALANGTDYGLAATVFTGSPERSERVAAALVAGTVWVNCFYVRDLETPFGGARDSGIGREGGHHSFDFYCDVKTVCERTAGFRA